MNGGWVQLAGPLSRIVRLEDSSRRRCSAAQSQQVRYPPTRAAYTAALAISRMFMLPGATYVDPDSAGGTRSGRRAPTFVKGNALGAEYDGTLWIGSARSFQQVGDNGGSLYRFKLTADRLHVDVSADPAAGRPRRRQPVPRHEIRRHRERNAADRHRASARRPISSRAPTATSTSSRSPTTRSTRSAAGRSALPWLGARIRPAPKAPSRSPALRHWRRYIRPCWSRH